MIDSEIFTRLYYYGTVQMHMSDERFWTMPLGLFLDLWEAHKQFLGIAKPKLALSIDDILPCDLA